uniref:Cytochrome c oxidase subunit 2 n=1 Tax=Tinaminyssus melloi TaxID=105222 RepID=A0A5Q0S299_9ACAR|nr:cytochrome c oxidase subunit II [Tinaminyssus melloi]QGA47507.1 cytochrome c oxidase subunit II [Tinaminyssus melloi]
MSFWNTINFMDANSPIMEQLIFFHDHTMIIMINIMMIISYLMAKIMFNNLYNRFFYENHKMEMTWTFMPAILLIFIAIPSLRLLYLVDEMFNPAMTIKITGHQWYWSYEYSDLNWEIDSFMIPDFESKNNNFRLLDVDNRLTIPFNMNLRLLVTSFDVIHSWTIPSLGVKIDAVPGRINQINFLAYRPGLFFGQCSEICGANHSFMPICMEVTSLNNFMLWGKHNF